MITLKLLYSWVFCISYITDSILVLLIFTKTFQISYAWLHCNYHFPSCYNLPIRFIVADIYDICAITIYNIWYLWYMCICYIYICMLHSLKLDTTYLIMMAIIDSFFFGSRSNNYCWLFVLGMLAILHLVNISHKMYWMYACIVWC